MTKLKSVGANNYPCTIWIAGDFNKAQDIVRQFCFEKGECVTVTKTEYIYTGGQENGVLVKFINYPRFPRTRDAIFKQAHDLGVKLLEGLYQKSFTIETDTKTFWFSLETENSK